MNCSRCNHENPPGQKFCGECGSQLAVPCAVCGASNPPEQKFCGDCGAALTDGAAFPPAAMRSAVQGAPESPAARTPAGAAAAQGERRQAAVLFADICGYTALCASNDPEQVQALLGRFYEVTDHTIEAYGGHVLDHAGDGVLAVFGAPVAHGNDAERAVRAALDMHARAAQLADGSGRPLALHIGIAAGEVVAAVISGGAQPKYSVTGDTVNLAARLDAAAQPGETLVSETLFRAVARAVDAEALGEIVVKGFDKPLPVWKVRGLQPTAAEHRPFVGRHAELRQLSGLIEAVSDHGTGMAVAVRGETGIGKSRLVAEFRMQAAARGFACHTGNVLDFGVAKGHDAIPVILKDLLQVPAPSDELACRRAVDQGLESGLIDTDHQAFINDLLDLPQPDALRAIFDAMDSATRSRRTVEAVSEVCKRASKTRPRVLVFEDIHWASGALLRLLGQLTIAAAESAIIMVMTSRFEGDPLDKAWRASTRRSPLTTIDLGPLRPEEARMLAADLLETASQFAIDAIERAEGNPLFLEQLLRSARESGTSNVPATIQSIVLARMDRLATPDKQALQAASVIGKRFALDALRFLIDQPGYDCDALVAGELVRPEAGDYLFANALIQEGVYSSLLKSRKREVHRKAAEWFGERDPVLRAEHLDRAENTGAAAAYLEAASDQAQRYRYDLALKLAERGIELANDRPTQYALTMLRGDVLREVGRSQDSLAAFQSALDFAGDEAERCRAWMGKAACGRITGDFALAMDALGQAQPIAERLELADECSRIHNTRGNVFFAQGDVTACHEEHQIAFDYARRSGDHECEARALSGLGDAALAQARMLTALGYFRRCVDLAQRAGLTRVEIPNRSLAGACQIYSNQLDAALSDCQVACNTASRVGVLHAEITAQQLLAIVLVQRGEHENAKKALERALSLARPAGARRPQSMCLCLLAIAHVAQGQRQQAREYLAQSLDLARQTGVRFFGPAIFSALALAAEDADERRRALQQGEALLGEGCSGQSHLWFYRQAIDAALAAQDWAEAERYATALEDYVRPEPLPWAQLIVARGRALVALGKHGRNDVTVGKLAHVRDEIRRVRLGSALPGIEAALA